MLIPWRNRRNRPEPLQYVFGEITLDQISTLTTDEIYETLAQHSHNKSLRAQLEAELRYREAWRSPQGKAIWISLAALGVSLIALVKSFLG
jgi:hypothetical protein